MTTNDCVQSRANPRGKTRGKTREMTEGPRDLSLEFETASFRDELAAATFSYSSSSSVRRNGGSGSRFPKSRSECPLAQERRHKVIRLGTLSPAAY